MVISLEEIGRTRSVQSNAAVDDQLRAGNVARILRQQESCCPGHFVGCAEPFQERYARIQESSVEMIRKCFDFVTQRLGGSQITGIRGKDDHAAESLFSGSKSFGIASGDDDPRALSA